MEVQEIEEAVRRKNEEAEWRRWLALVEVAEQRWEEEEKEHELEEEKKKKKKIQKEQRKNKRGDVSAAAVDVSAGPSSRKPRIKFPRQPAAGSHHHHHQPSEGTPEIPRQPLSTGNKDEEAAAAVNVSTGSPSKNPRMKIPRQPAAGSHRRHHHHHHQPSERTPEISRQPVSTCIKDEGPAAAAVVNGSAGSPSKQPRIKIPRQPAAGSRHHQHHQPPEGIPEMPEIFRRKIAEMGGENVTFVIEKKLYGTDVSSQHNRLSIPMNQIRQDFVTEEERTRLNSHDPNMNGIEVILVEPSLREEEVMLKKWRMKETSVLYVLIKNWHHIAKRNGLHVNNVVRVWTFRVQSKLSFAIVKVGKDEKGKTAAGKKNDGGSPERKEVVEYDGGSNNYVS